MSKPFELPVEMTIYGVAQTRDSLLAWLAEQSSKPSKILDISATQVCEIDGAGLQLLISLSHTGQAWRLVGASDVFIDACQTLGLGRWLDSVPSTPRSESLVP